MSDEYTNIVLEGAYKGSKITSINMDNGGEYVLVGSIVMSSKNVDSVEVINANDGNQAMKGALVAGTVGAVVGTSVSDMLVRIRWKSNAESIVRVRSGMYSSMVVSAAHLFSVSSEEIKKQKSEDNRAAVIGFIVIAVIWLICYLVGRR